MRDRKSSPPLKVRKYSPTPDEGSPQVGRSPSPAVRKRDASYSESPKEKSRSPGSPERENSPEAKKYQSPSEANGRSHSRSPSPRDDRSPVYDDEDDNRPSPRGSESP